MPLSFIPGGLIEKGKAALSYSRIRSTGWEYLKIGVSKLSTEHNTFFWAKLATKEYIRLFQFRTVFSALLASKEHFISTYSPTVIFLNPAGFEITMLLMKSQLIVIWNVKVCIWGQIGFWQLINYVLDHMLYKDGYLTHRGRVTHICVGKPIIISSENLFRTNAGKLLFWPSGTSFSEILIEIHIFLFKKIRLKMSSGKWWAFWLGLNVLTVLQNIPRNMHVRAFLFHGAVVVICFTSSRFTSTSLNQPWRTKLCMFYGIYCIFRNVSQQWESNGNCCEWTGYENTYVRYHESLCRSNGNSIAWWRHDMERFSTSLALYVTEKRYFLILTRDFLRLTWMLVGFPKLQWALLFECIHVNRITNCRIVCSAE